MPRTSVLKESAPPRPTHERHRPEKTLLYGIIDRYYPEFRDYMLEQGRKVFTLQTLPAIETCY